MGYCKKEGPGSAAHGACAHRLPIISGLAAFVTHRKRGREGKISSGPYRRSPDPSSKKTQSLTRRKDPYIRKERAGGRMGRKPAHATSPMGCMRGGIGGLYGSPPEKKRAVQKNVLGLSIGFILHSKATGANFLPQNSTWWYVQGSIASAIVRLLKKKGPGGKTKGGCT
jgi:hypothetical protein